VEKDLCAIGAIIDDEESKESKQANKKSQYSSSKAKEKDNLDMESLGKSLKALNNEVLELKRNLREVSINGKPPKYFLFKRNNKNQPTKSA